MHKNAHGEVPHRVIEVDANIVESFLGRIEDPAKSQNTDLNIIYDPAFRTIMVCNFYLPIIPEKKMASYNLLDKYRENLIQLSKQYNGRVVRKDHNQYLISYRSVTDCINCALQICDKNNASSCSPIKIKIGINAGVPVTAKDTIFEECIKLAAMMCNVCKAYIIISKEVNDLYTSENMNVALNHNSIYSLNKLEETFIESFHDYLEEHWRNTQLRIEDFCVQLGYSKSRLYRIATDLF